MNWRKRIYTSAPKGKRTWLDRYFSILAVFAIVFGTLGTANAAPVAQQPVAAALTNTIALSVMSTDGVTAIPTYKWIINVDNTGDPLDQAVDCYPTAAGATDPDYLSFCDWPSVHTIRGSSPIFTQGTQADLDGATGITLPSGKYLISVIADGYKIDGKHFTVPMEEPGLVEVQMQPMDLPPATLRIKVFMDDRFTNGQFDAPAEEPLAPGNPALASKINADGLRVGFKAHLGDPLGEISADVFGNPLCTQYDVDGNPLPGNDQSCLFADEFGNIAIPNLGPNRYEVWVVPPDGENWIQTTTLEGNNPWDTWLQEGATGYDTEFVVGAEPFPWTIFGFVPADMHYHSGLPDAITTAPTNSDGLVTGGIAGDIHIGRVYVPWNAGNAYQGSIWGGFKGVRDGGPLAGAVIALSSINLGDTLVYVGKADNNGHFQITNVPDGNYTLTYWDDALLYLLDLQQVTVAAGVVTNMTDTNNNGVFDPAEDLNNNGVLDPGEDLNNNGVLDLAESPLHLTGWFTKIEGTVFLDNNANGLRDAGEPGVFNYPLVVKKRDNSVVERGAVATVTGGDGSYEFTNTYPFGWWMVLEAYSDRYYTTGVTMYNVDFTQTAFNDPNANPLNPPLIETANPVTIIGQGVDVSFLPIIGQTGRVDWGVLPYDPKNGVLADPVGAQRLQNGGIVGTVSYDVTRNELDPRFAAVENWQPGVPDLTVNLYPAVKCTAPNTQNCDPKRKYQIDPATGALLKGNGGAPLQTAITESWAQPTGCVARDAAGVKVVEEALPRAADAKCLEGPMMGMQFGQEFAAVDGNYGFGGIPAGDYLVEVVIPNDTFGKPLYQVTKEEDINVFNGDSYTPLLPPPACAGALHLVDSTGNDTFLAEGASPWEGVWRPQCDVKLVQLGSGRSIAPTFNLFTDVPIPGKYYGYIVDDLNVASDPKALFYGEKNGIASPIGIYDFSNRLVTTISSDPHGVFEVLLPSTDTINCPSPSGICAGMYRLVGNDPGQPGQFNPTYNPQYRTISANFEVWPGIIIPADLAPTQMAASIQAPGSQFNNVAQCTLDAATPQLFAVSQPYVNGSGAFTIQGTGFGAAAGQVLLDGSILLSTTGWTDRQIDVTVPAGTPIGPHQLSIEASNGQSTVNGLTFHVLGAGYSPALFEVGVGKAYDPTDPDHITVDPVSGQQYSHALQDALNDASEEAQALVVVYPGAQGLFNPFGAYYENIIMHSPVKLQGVGPGGVYPDTTGVLGSVISGLGFGADTQYAEDWRVFIANLNIASPGVGEILFAEGQTVSVVATATDQYNTPSYKAAIDGFSLEGGDQMGFPNNLNQIFGTQNGLPVVVETQGGGIFVYAYARYLQITNNQIKNNSGSYAGGIRIGTPNWEDSHNDDMTIARNRIFANGGTNLAGGIGVFEGSRNYEIANNDLCGNFSAEYGGGISVYGLSPNGKIHHNRLYFNRSYDEAGGIMIAGELPADPLTLSPGSGPVDIYSNLVQGNLANDDGGGIRFLMSGNFPMNVYNNFIVNNISTHEGGGIALDDAPDVRFYNNTVMKNITTATALTSDGNPAAAGLATTHNSAAMQAALPLGSPDFSDPLMFNNIFWDNRAGNWDIATSSVSGIGIATDPNPIRLWDMGSTEPGITLSPTNSMLNENVLSSIVPDASNQIGVDPQVAATYDASVAVLPWRTQPGVVGIALVAVELPPNLLGNYHLQMTSPANDAGAASKGAISAPTSDIDGQLRPSDLGFEIGADEQPSTMASLTVIKVVVNDHGGTMTVGDFPLFVNGSPVASGAVSVLAPGTYTVSETGNASYAATFSGDCASDGTVLLNQGDAKTCTITNDDIAPLLTVTKVIENPSAVTTNFNLFVNGNPVTSGVQNAYSAGAHTVTETHPTGYIAAITGDCAADGTITLALGDVKACTVTYTDVPFAATAIIDTFNRGTGNVALGRLWRGQTSQANYRINTFLGARQVQVRANNGFIYWNQQFGANQEVYFTFTNVSLTAAEQDLLMKVGGLAGQSIGPNTYMIEVLYDRANSQVRIETLAPGQGWRVRATFTGVTFAAGDVFGARTLADGTVNVYKNGVRIGTTNVTAGATPWPAGRASGSGRLGIWFLGANGTVNGDAHFDNFGGGTMP